MLKYISSAFTQHMPVVLLNCFTTILRILTIAWHLLLYARLPAIAYKFLRVPACLRREPLLNGPQASWCLWYTGTIQTSRDLYHSKQPTT